MSVSEMKNLIRKAIDDSEVKMRSKDSSSCLLRMTWRRIAKQKIKANEGDNGERRL